MRWMTRCGLIVPPPRAGEDDSCVKWFTTALHIHSVTKSRDTGHHHRSLIDRGAGLPGMGHPGTEEVIPYVSDGANISPGFGGRMCFPDKDGRIHEVSVQSERFGQINGPGEPAARQFTRLETLLEY